MARFASVLLAVAFVIPAAPAFAGSSIRPGDAFAAGDEEDLGDDGDDLVRGKAAVDDKKGKKTTTPTITEEDDEPVEDFEMEDMEESEDEDEDEPSERLGNFEEDDELSVEAPVRKAAPAAASGPGPITLSVAGKEPLGDNYAMTVIAVDRDAVVVELPVLVARSRVAVEKGFVLVGEVFVGDVKVSEVQQTVTPQSLAEFGPSFAYLKVLAPVIDHAGEVRIVVKQTDIGGANAKTLFTRSTPYALN